MTPFRPMNRLPLLALVLAFVLPACSGLKVNSDYDAEADFSVYATFAWLPAPVASDEAQARGVSEILGERIQRAVDANLATKNMRKVSKAEAQLLVTYHLSVEEKIEFNDPYYAYDRVSTYEEGTMLIDLIDAKTERLIWRGSAQARIKNLDSAEQREERIREVVAAILAQYPPA